jgi:hypothetical protein
MLNGLIGGLTSLLSVFTPFIWWRTFGLREKISQANIVSKAIPKTNKIVVQW